MKYTITALSDPFGEDICDRKEDDPQNAIIAWCQLQEDHPTCVAICGKDTAAGKELIKWASENFDKIRVWMKEHKCPYKTDWIKDVIDSYIRRDKSPMGWDGDQISPFSFG